MLQHPFAARSRGGALKWVAFSRGGFMVKLHKRMRNSSFITE
jgi:hypothetical protein